MLHVVHLVLWLDELLLRDDDCEQDLKGRPLAVSCTSLSPQKLDFYLALTELTTNLTSHSYTASFCISNSI